MMRRPLLHPVAKTEGYQGFRAHRRMVDEVRHWHERMAVAIAQVDVIEHVLAGPVVQHEDLVDATGNGGRLHGGLRRFTWEKNEGRRPSLLRRAVPRSAQCSWRRVTQEHNWRHTTQP